MRSLKYGYALLALTILVPLSGFADEPQLRGYTPPPMFGNSMSVPVEMPPAQEPPVVKPVPTEKPVSKEQAKSLVTKPPQDKEIVVKDTPLPIKPLKPKAIPPKPTTVPEKTKLPPYIPPKVTEKPKPEKAKPRPAKTQPAPNVKDAAIGISAESLLSHPVTSESNPIPVSKPSNPLAVPASKVEEGLPLPGSVPVQKSVLQKSKTSKFGKKAEAKKLPATVKKPEVKKAQPKKAEPEKKIKPLKPVTKTETPKKAEIKSQAKKENKKEIVKPAAPVKTESKLEEIKPAPKPQKPYSVKGGKTMPKVAPTKVDKSEIAKLPLPAIETPAVKTMPTINEQMIDKALNDHMVEPDLKKIMGEDKKQPVTQGKPKLADTPATIPAKLPAKKTTPKPELISLEFTGASADLGADQKNVIESSIIAKLKEDDSRRLQILSFASPAKEGQSSARRISLSRGLAIRSFLLEKGIQPGRIDIRALGENTKEKPIDRVDLMVVYLR